MTFEDFQARVDAASQEGDDRLIVPVSIRRSADLLTPVSAFLALRDDAEHCFLFESVEGGEKLARYSFLGRRPYRLVRATDFGATVTIDERRVPAPEREMPSPEGTIFEVLDAYLDRYREVPIPDLPRLRGGAVGFMGYDTVRLVEDLPDAPPDALNVPDAVWGFYDTVVAFDHVKHQLVLVANAFIGPDTDLRTAYERA
ncbi:MAG: anthranilate synthase component I, partial [Salinibacter sp.]